MTEMAPAMTEMAEGGGGYLAINTRPWSKVYLGPRQLGTTPLGRVEAPSGTVRLRFEDRDGNVHNRTVRVSAGETTRQFFDFQD